MNDTIDAASDSEWEANEPAPQKKRRIPKWLLFGCGCGCLVTLIVVAVIGWGLSQMLDPEVQWPKLEKVLPHDERPTDLEMQLGMGIPFAQFEMFTLVDVGDKYTANVYVFDSLDSSDARAMFSDELSGSFGQPKGVEMGEREIQGRTVRSMSFTGVRGISSVDPLGGGVRIDVSREGGPGLWVVELRTMVKNGAVTDDQVEDFFGHFDVWR